MYPQEEVSDAAAPSEAGTAPDNAPDDEELEKQPDDETMEGETTLLPKSLFGDYDCQPGEIKRVKVVHVYGDEIEVAGLPPEDQEKGMGAMGEAEGRMSDYMGGE